MVWGREGRGGKSERIDSGSCSLYSICCLFYVWRLKVWPRGPLVLELNVLLKPLVVAEKRGDARPAKWLSWNAL